MTWLRVSLCPPADPLASDVALTDLAAASHHPSLRCKFSAAYPRHFIMDHAVSLLILASNGGHSLADFARQRQQEAQAQDIGEDMREDDDEEEEEEDLGEILGERVREFLHMFCEVVYSAGLPEDISSSIAEELAERLHHKVRRNSVVVIVISLRCSHWSCAQTNGAHSLVVINVLICRSAVLSLRRSGGEGCRVTLTAMMRRWWSACRVRSCRRTWRQPGT